MCRRISEIGFEARPALAPGAVRRLRGRRGRAARPPSRLRGRRGLDVPGRPDQQIRASARRGRPVQRLFGCDAKRQLVAAWREVRVRDLRRGALGFKSGEAGIILDHMEGVEPGDVTGQFYSNDPQSRASGR